MSDAAVMAVVLAAVAAIAVLPVVARHRRHNRMVEAKLERARRLGINETLSLHPAVDHGLCIGCGECSRACPEQDVLALYHHKAVVVDATECVGHGLCERVCPVSAITLVVGTETRGLELPALTEFFETNVPGLFVVGELGGMGLIRNAIWQATQAVAHIARRCPPAPRGGVQLAIAGAGPAGLAAAIAARAAGLTFRVLEQEALGGSMLHYPRRKLVMTHVASLPGVGEFPFREIEKEPLIEFWRSTAQALEITVDEGTVLANVVQADGSFDVRTSKGSLRAARVILALGRRGTPRRLDVPGEESSKVVYRLLEPAQFQGRRVLVVGGGSAALEASLSLAAQAGTTVTLVHRRDVFAGARGALVEKLLETERRGRIEVLRQARVTAIHPDRVELDVNGAPAERGNDAVFVMIGGTPPYEILRASGVILETRFAAPIR